MTSPIQMLQCDQLLVSALRSRGAAVVLSLDDANRVMHGALAKARELNVRVSVAIRDAGGRLFAFQRMENSILASVYASQGKAITSVRRFAGPERQSRPRRGYRGGRRHLNRREGRLSPSARWRRCGCVRRRRRCLGSGRAMRASRCRALLTVWFVKPSDIKRLAA
jgi:hypothetical protein